jgi:hypothetical protein
VRLRRLGVGGDSCELLGEDLFALLSLSLLLGREAFALLRIPVGRRYVESLRRDHRGRRW